MAQSYLIKPSEVMVPKGVQLGNYERVIRPFTNWTLICDENLEKREKVCNVTQIIEDRAGKTIFSWSLAATANGEPYMILRADAQAKSDGLITLQFDGERQPITARIDGCNRTVCVAMLPVGDTLRRQIANSTTPTVSYALRSGGSVTVRAPLKGLSAALAAIR
ncbi:MAG TPA: invasion associated locus B family protein [Rhizomicrobium sp.]|nr:invasion associated locus B family protein [Rhizomicrobium sp.]